MLFRSAMFNWSYGNKIYNATKIMASTHTNRKYNNLSEFMNLGRRFLISESVRGEGAWLLNKAGERFTDELQPRDVVSHAIWKQMEIDGTEHVWEDLRPLGRDVILQHFPHIYKQCKDEGYDVLVEPIPVVPAQHYHMGGVKADRKSVV